MRTIYINLIRHYSRTSQQVLKLISYNPFLLNYGETAFFNLTGSVILSLSVSLEGGKIFNLKLWRRLTTSATISGSWSRPTTQKGNWTRALFTKRFHLPNETCKILKLGWGRLAQPHHEDHQRCCRQRLWWGGLNCFAICWISFCSLFIYCHQYLDRSLWVLLYRSVVAKGLLNFQVDRSLNLKRRTVWTRKGHKKPL